MINIAQLTKNYTIKDQNGHPQTLEVLHDISLSVPKSTIVSLVGPTGCGKSTLLEILAGLQVPNQGNVAIDGQLMHYKVNNGLRDLTPPRNRYRRNSPTETAMVFQDYAVFPWMTVEQNIDYVLSLKGIQNKFRKTLSGYWIEKVGLSDSYRKYPSQLSGGMKQRLALARAFAVKPKLILMDEPFASVDEITRDWLHDLLLEIWRESGVTIVMVTHNIAEAIYLSDQVIILAGQPAGIREIINISTDRPRDRNSEHIVGLHKELSHELSVSR